jgi:hypothetical protein
MGASDFLIEVESRRVSSSAGIEARVAAISRLATLFGAAKLRLTTELVQRLSQLAGCSSASMKAFLFDRGLRL